MATPQQPAEKTMDFTVNYINQALAQGGSEMYINPDLKATSYCCASFTLKGTYINFTYQLPGYSQPIHATISISLGDPMPDIQAVNNGVQFTCQNAWGSPDYLCARDYWDAGSEAELYQYGFNMRQFTIPIDTTGNPYKPQDVKNAILHIRQLLVAQQQQEQQQNQSDPFAKPQ
jgi:hypothetical protein